MTGEMGGIYFQDLIELFSDRDLDLIATIYWPKDEESDSETKTIDVKFENPPPANVREELMALSESSDLVRAFAKTDKTFQIMMNNQNWRWVGVTRDRFVQRIADFLRKSGYVCYLMATQIAEDGSVKNIPCETRTFNQQEFVENHRHLLESSEEILYTEIPFKEYPTLDQLNFLGKRGWQLCHVDETDRKMIMMRKISKST